MTNELIELLAEWDSPTMCNKTPWGERAAAMLRKLAEQDDGTDALVSDLVEAEVRKRMAEQKPLDWSAIESAAEAFVADYEMRGEDEEGADAAYTPTDAERDMISDAIRGLFVDDAFLSALNAAPVAVAEQTPVAYRYRFENGRVSNWFDISLPVSLDKNRTIEYAYAAPVAAFDVDEARLNQLEEWCKAGRRVEFAHSLYGTGVEIGLHSPVQASTHSSVRAAIDAYLKGQR